MGSESRLSVAGSAVIGLDIGGANLKAAHTNKIAISQPFPLWKQPELLSSAISRLVANLPSADAVAATMTGELCDCFTSKTEGVRHIVEALRRALPDKKIYLWRTDGRFVRVEDVGNDLLPLAAANWLALAHLAGRLAARGESILIDMGSTTTDIIALADGQPRQVGRTDLERLRSGELVYVGADRTPLCALLGPPYAAELFATTKDVYLQLGMLAEDEADHDTADGRAATLPCARARIARMLCADVEQLAIHEINQIALDADLALRKSVQKALMSITARLASLPQVVVVSGSGEFLARAIAVEMFGIQPRVISLEKELGAELSSAACAYAVALLAREELARV